MEDWFRDFRLQARASSRENDTPLIDKSSSERFHLKCQESAEKLKDARVAVPIDITWVDGLADLKFAPTDVSASSTLPLDTTEVENHLLQVPLHRSIDSAPPPLASLVDISYGDSDMDDMDDMYV